MLHKLFGIIFIIIIYYSNIAVWYKFTNSILSGKWNCSISSWRTGNKWAMFFDIALATVTNVTGKTKLAPTKYWTTLSNQTAKYLLAATSSTKSPSSSSPTSRSSDGSGANTFLPWTTLDWPWKHDVNIYVREHLLKVKAKYSWPPSSEYQPV